MDDIRRASVLSNSSTVSNSIDKRRVEASPDVQLEPSKRLRLQLKSFQEENIQLASELKKFRERVLHFEEEKVTLTTNFNKENSRNLAEIGKLQSLLEKGEAARQSIEFDLAVVKKKSNDTLRSTTQRESALAEGNRNLTAERNHLETKVEDLEKALQIARRVTMEDEKRIAFLMDEKKQSESDHLASEAVLRSHHDKLVEEKSIRDAEMAELKSAFKDLEANLIRKEEELRNKIGEMKVLSEKEQNARAELHNMSLRCRALEESVEAERAAHLESKFNAEIIQLKHQETESALGSQQELGKKLADELENTNKRCENFCAEANSAKKCEEEAKQKLERAMQVHEDARKKLEQESSIKSERITELSTQITKQLENYENLKAELSKARKRQIYLEETYSGNMREVELLLSTYCEDPAVKPAPKKSEKGKGSHPDPKIILERLRVCMLSMKKDVEDMKKSVETSKATEQCTQKDCDNFRDRALAREKDLQASQKEIINCRMELDSIRMKQADYERETDRMRRDLAEITGEFEQQTRRCEQLEKDAANLIERHKNEMEAHMSFLRELHHALGPHARGITSLTKFTWSEFSVGVREGIDSALNSLSRLKEKNHQLEFSNSQLEKTVNEMQNEHEASVDRLARQCRDREQEALRQRRQLESHYNALIEEMESRAQKSQGLCDEAWERIRAGDGITEALHAECAQLRGENGNMQQERNALTCACALLLGSLYPALRARDDLARQRDLLMRMNEDSLVFKNQLRILVETLSEELKKPGDSKANSTSAFRKIHPLIRFRVAAVAVLAANRMQVLAKRTNVTMFACDESSASSNRLIVVAGKPSSTSDSSREESQSDLAMMWLCDPRTVHSIRESMCGLVEALDESDGKKKGYMSRTIVKTAKNSFLNVLKSTHPMFSSLVYTSSDVIRERSSLIYLLSEGLERLVLKFKLSEIIKLHAPEHALSSLQRHLLNFTERLHAAEVEKRNLRNNAGKLKAQIQQLERYKADLDHAKEEVKDFKTRESQLIPKKRFDGVCVELNAALEREQQAQKLLHEQNDKLQELSARLDEQWTEGAEKEQTLSQVVENLTEVKMELKRCTQSKRVLTKQVMKLEQEKDSLGDKVTDATEALKKAAREKDSLATYFLSIEKLLKKTPDNPCELASTKISPEMSDGEAGPDVLAAKRAVQSFVRAQSSAVSRITSLEDQIASYRSHIGALKKELHDACKRENPYGSSFEISHIPTRDVSSLANGERDRMTECSTPKESDFQPLKGVIADESTYSLPQYKLDGEQKIM